MINIVELMGLAARTRNPRKAELYETIIKCVLEIQDLSENVFSDEDRIKSKIYGDVIFFADLEEKDTVFASRILREMCYIKHKICQNGAYYQCWVHKDCPSPKAALFRKLHHLE